MAPRCRMGRLSQCLLHLSPSWLFFLLVHAGFLGNYLSPPFRPFLNVPFQPRILKHLISGQESPEPIFSLSEMKASMIAAESEAMKRRGETTRQGFHEAD